MDIWRKRNAMTSKDETVWVDANCIGFEADGSSVYLHHADAIGAAKAILKHFGEECDAAAEMRGATQSKDASIARLEAEVVLLRNQRNDLSDRMSRALEEKDGEIAHFRSKLAEATDLCREVRSELDEARRRASEAEKGVEALDELTRCYRMVIADAIVRGGLERR